MTKAGRVPRLSFNPSDDHAFYELGSRRFEYFACAIHAAQPDILGAHPYGPDGQTQFGADHIAFHRSDGAPYLEVGQSKAERRFGQTQIRDAANAFLDHWVTHWKAKDVRRFILFVGSAIKSREAAEEIIVQTMNFAALGVAFEVWHAKEIYEKLPSAPGAVRTYLDQQWYERIFGKPTGPLTDMLGELEAGASLGALKVQSYVTRLNQAESAEMIELKRRARRGEAARVVEELELALASPAAAALAPAVKADKLRLLAGLLLPGRDHMRVGRLLDDADLLDGDSTRLRAIILLESVGSEAVLAAYPHAGDAELAEVLAVAELRLGGADRALAALEPFVGTEAPRSETLRLAAIAELLRAKRDRAVSLAEQAVERDPDSRVCRQMLAIALFHRALSPAARPSTGDWPEPVDQPLVGDSDAARADLERAEALLRGLAEDDRLEGHVSAIMWHFGVLACCSWRREEAEARLSALQADRKLPIPLIVWALTRALPFDRAAAIAQCDARLTEKPDDFETLFIRIALAHAARDLATVDRLLDAKDEALRAAGHAAIVDYWRTLIALDSRKQPGASVSNQPWLRLRQATTLRRKRARLDAIQALLEDELAASGDARVVLTTTQMLLEAGRHRSAAKAAPYLVEKVATAEAIATAAHAYFHDEQPQQVLSVLARADAFPGNALPLDLERLRAASLAVSGDLVGARQASLELAATTRHPNDLWRTIGLQLATGAEADAVALYEAHEETLAAPGPEHVQLARSVLQSHPETAARITRSLSAAEIPDMLVTSVFELAGQLRLRAELRVLTGRLQELGMAGKGGVTMVSLDDIMASVQLQRAQAEQNFETYANAGAPIHAMANQGRATLARTHLAALAAPPAPGEARPLLSARYGRSYADDAWPDQARDVSLIADLTALLTASALDLLDMVERAFAPILIPPDTIPLLAAMRAGLEVAQPERIEAMRAVVSLYQAGAIHYRSAAPSGKAYEVHWEDDGGAPETALSFPRLVEIGTKKLSAKATREARLRLGNILDAPALGARPRRSSIVHIEIGMAISLEEAGLLAPLARHFRIALDAAEVEACRAEIADADQRSELTERLTILIGRLRTGLEDGCYQALPHGQAHHKHPLTRAYLQLVEKLHEGGCTLWADDRFTSSVAGPQFPVASTVELIDALVRYKRLSPEQALASRQKLRAARWIFLPLSEREIVHYLRDAVRDGEVRETPDLAILRRGMGEILANRRRLHWPNGEAAAQGHRGEIPFVLEWGHAISAALVDIWADEGWTIADAKAASTWMLYTLDLSMFPMPGIPAGDPRSDILLGIHLGSLVLVGVQILRSRSRARRQKAYFKWLWNDVVAQMLRVRPELREPMEQLVEGHFAHAEGQSDEPIWLGLAARAVNAMPEGFRHPLLQRPALRRAFNIPDHQQVNIGDLSFDELSFWKAVLKATAGKPTQVETESGERAILELSDRKGSHLNLRLGKRRYRLDAWPRRIASNDPATRRAALDEREDRLDLSAAALDALAAELGTIGDPVGRIRLANARVSETARSHYADLEARVRDRESFAFWNLRPEHLSRLVHDLRLDGTIEDAAAQLIAERGLANAIRRLGGLPITPPAPLRAAIGALDEAALDRLIEDVEVEGAPPWTLLLLARLLLERSDAAAFAPRCMTWIDKALCEEGRDYWRLYLALAEFVCQEGPGDLEWSALTGAQQLACCWHHAGALTEILGSGPVQIEPLIEMLDNNRLARGRRLVEATDGFEGDIADPRAMHVDRLVLYAAAPALTAMQDHNGMPGWTEGHVRNLLTERDPDGTSRPRMSILHGAATERDLLGSHLKEAWSEPLAEIVPQSHGLVHEDIENLLGALLRNEEDHRSWIPWFLLRAASADAPMPIAIATLAQTRGKSFDLADAGDDLAMARSSLLSFTALAAANSWRDENERIATAALALGPRPDDTEGLELLEIAVLRARLVEDPIERTQQLAEDLVQLGSHALLRDHAAVAARQFARSLSGSQADAFIEAYAQLIRMD
ncbi:MAG TPA: hypothetical protein VIT38_11960 [Allosphingosinicella sp.]